MHDYAATEVQEERGSQEFRRVVFTLFALSFVRIGAYSSAIEGVARIFVKCTSTACHRAASVHVSSIIVTEHNP